MEMLEKAYDWYKDYGSSIVMAEWAVACVTCGAYYSLKTGDLDPFLDSIIFGVVTGVAPAIILSKDAYENRNGHGCCRMAYKHLSQN